MERNGVCVGVDGVILDGESRKGLYEKVVVERVLNKVKR